VSDYSAPIYFIEIMGLNFAVTLLDCHRRRIWYDSAMTKHQQAWLSWSSGKDSAFTLFELLKNPKVAVKSLLTTVNETYARVAMHAVRETLLRAQAEALGIPLKIIYLPVNCTNEMYETRMLEAIAAAKQNEITHVAFGDLYLEEIRCYREKMLAPTGLAPLFPLWKRPTRDLASEMISAGFKAVITCVDPRVLPGEFAGRMFDEEFLSDLPAGVDPCGENGEFHTFVFEGPIFNHPLSVKIGERVTRDGFVFSDVLPN
jgi:uncharacterized protein (TIGR00290 family)